MLFESLTFFLVFGWGISLVYLLLETAVGESSSEIRWKTAPGTWLPSLQVGSNNSSYTGYNSSETHL